jgi:hypothetical protein
LKNRALQESRFVHGVADLFILLSLRQRNRVTSTDDETDILAIQCSLKSLKCVC